MSLGDIAPRQVKPLTEVINGKPSDHGNYSVINYCGDFQLANETLWFDLRGFEERLLRAQFADTNVQKKAMIHGYKLKAIYDIDVFHLNHAQGGGGSKGSNKVAVNDSNSLKTQNRTQNDEHWGLWKQDVPVLDEAALQHNNAQEIFMIGRFRRVRIYLKLRRWLRSLKRLLLYSPIKN